MNSWFSHVNGGDVTYTIARAAYLKALVSTGVLSRKEEDGTKGNAKKKNDNKKREVILLMDRGTSSRSISNSDEILDGLRRIAGYRNISTSSTSSFSSSRTK